MSTHETDTTAEAMRTKGNLVRMLSVLSAGHAIKHLFNMGFFVLLPEIKTGLGLTNAGVGTLATFRNVAGGVTNLPAGFLADRYSGRFVSILVVTIVMIGVFHFALGHVGAFWQAIAAATMATVFITAWHPAAIGALSRVFGARRGFAIALHGTGGSIGEAVSPILVGSLLVVMSWRGVLQVSLAPALLMAILIWLLLRSTTVVSRPVTAREYFSSFGGLFRNGKLLLVLLITGGYGASQSAVLTFLPVYIREDLGHSTIVLGLYLSLTQVFGIGSQPVMGYLSDRLGRQAVIVPSILGMGLTFLGLYLVPSGVPFILMLALMGVFIFSLMAMLLAAASDLVSEELQGTSVSLIYGTFFLFAGISPIVAGLIADAIGMRPVFLYSASIALATSLFAFIARWQRSRSSAG